jgi:hypothetical protein
MIMEHYFYSLNATLTRSSIDTGRPDFGPDFGHKFPPTSKRHRLTAVRSIRWPPQSANVCPKSRLQLPDLDSLAAVHSGIPPSSTVCQTAWFTQGDQIEFKGLSVRRQSLKSTKRYPFVLKHPATEIQILWFLYCQGRFSSVMPRLGGMETSMKPPSSPSEVGSFTASFGIWKAVLSYYGYPRQSLVRKTCTTMEILTLSRRG